MKLRTLSSVMASCCLASAVAQAQVASDPKMPHLEKRGTVTQLVVDGKPFMMLSGELRNSSASSKAYMEPFWPQLAQRNLNTVLAVITWELIEPTEGHFDFTTVDDTILGARKNGLHLVILWFGSWKNGESSYQPYWVKADPQRYPWVKDRTGKTLNIISTFGDATRDGDAKAYGALMRHIKEVDGKDHTVLMMQVENEVGVLGDSRDHCAAANDAFAKPVPQDLMDYLVKHKDTMAPELSAVWAANGNKTSGTWEQVFGPGKPDNVPTIPPIPAAERDTAWHKSYWLVDEAFMAWRYSAYVNKVAAAGKAEYPIPMYCNTWLQEPQNPTPGQFPSGCPEPEVHDIWRFGAPNLDFLAPDLYVTTFAETCERFMRNGNPLFIPETSANPSNALLAFLKYGTMGYSPFGIEGGGGGGRGGAAGPDALAQTYAILDYMSPVILANQGKGTIVMLQPDTNTAPQTVKLGDYTLDIKNGAGGVVGGPGGGGGAARGGAGGGGGGRGGAAGGGAANASPARFVINAGPGDYWFVGGPMGVTFTPNTPEKGSVVMGSFDETTNVNGRWVAGRRLNGDETHNNANWPGMGQFGIYHYTVFQRP